MVSRSKAVTDGHVCVAVHPCRVNQTIRIAASAVMHCFESLALLLDNLNWILLKHSKIIVSAMPCFLVGKSRKAPWWCNWLVKVVDSCTLLTSMSGTRSSGLAKSKLALLQVKPHLPLP